MIRIVEVGPRDGLQNEPASIPTEAKVAFVNALSDAKPYEIEVSAFVSPKWVPQLSDADAVLDGIERQSGVVYSALVPNERGMERAMRARVDKVAVFTAASESFTRKNVNASIDDTFGRFKPVVDCARGENLIVRGYISTAFWCPYEGFIAPERVTSVAERLFALGVDEVSIGDTIGKASPSEVRELLDVLLRVIDVDKVAMHLHDTYGRAIANVMAAYDYGVEMFDTSAGGLGGCPYAPGAPGNVSTRSVVSALRDAGATVEVNVDALLAAQRLVAPYVSRPMSEH